MIVYMYESCQRGTLSCMPVSDAGSPGTPTYMHGACCKSCLQNGGCAGVKLDSLEMNTHTNRPGPGRACRCQTSGFERSRSQTSWVAAHLHLRTGPFSISCLFKQPSHTSPHCLKCVRYKNPPNIFFWGKKTHSERMASTIKYIAGAAALYAITTQPPFANFGIFSSTRRAVDSTMLVLYKVSAGTGRCVFQSSRGAWHACRACTTHHTHHSGTSTYAWRVSHCCSPPL